MLGINRKGPWDWAALGKHPAAKDFIRIGKGSSLMEAVAVWSSKGFDGLQRAKNRTISVHSWRFWLRGLKKGTLICGLGRDSSDSIGRSYPLLIMGEGRIRRWEKKWPQLTLQLSNSWKSMEYAVTQRFDNVQGLEKQIRNLKNPGTKFKIDMIPSSIDQNGDLDRKIFTCKRSIEKNGYGTICLNSEKDDGPEQCAMQYLDRLRAICGKIPLGVFFGGPPQKSYVMVLQRPLSTEDFIRLWTL